MTTASFDLNLGQTDAGTRRVGLNVEQDRAALAIYTEAAGGEHLDWSAVELNAEQCRLLGHSLINFAEGLPR